MRRGMLAGLLAAISLAVSGCGGGDGGRSDSSPSAAGDYLAVVQATGGTLMKQGSGLKLTLNGVAPQVLAFTDRPERRAGAVGSSTFFNSWANEYGGDPPNAALALLNGRSGADTVILALDPPSSQGSSVGFSAQPVSSTPAHLEQFEKQVDPSVPTGFGDASLFLDAGGIMQLVAYGDQDVYLSGG